MEQDSFGIDPNRNRCADCCCCGKKLLNVIFLGIGFMLLFTAFQTSSMIEKTVLTDAQENSTFSGNGYTSLSIIYGVFAASNWAAPSIVAIFGPKWSMVLGGSLYCLFIASFLKPMTWTLYLGSALVGIGAAVLWTGQGTFLTINSDPDTIGRNSSLFWALLQMSLLAGNLYVYIAFEGAIEVTNSARFTLYSVFTVIGVLGVIALISLRSIKPHEDDDDTSVNASVRDKERTGPLTAFKNSVKLLFTRNMLLLSVVFAYTGFELTFWSGVYGTCIGATGHFSTGLIGLTGICIGIGEILGGGLFGLLSKRTNKYGRDPIVLIGFIVHMAAFFVIFLSLPSDSPQKNEATGLTYIKPNKIAVLICAFLLGFGDSCYNTQIYSLIGSAYADDSAPAFALFKFLQSLASAVGFAYSNVLGLQWQLLVLVVFGIAGTLTFFVVEWSLRNINPGYVKIKD